MKIHRPWRRLVGASSWWADVRRCPAWLQDDMRGVRSQIGLASMRVGGVFRTTVEDNVAVATTREVQRGEGGGAGLQRR